MKPLVTVAIPTLNRLSYLRETLRAVRDQDYENLEILVSDNASSDGTEVAMEALAQEEPRLRYRRNPSPAPITVHFNQCLQEATGEFFVLLSDDDRISPSFVSKLTETLIANRRATVAVPANAIIDSDGALVRSLPPPDKTLFEGVDFVIEWLWKIHDLPVANLVTVMGRTRTMRKLRYHPFPNGFNSDNLLFLQLALAGQVSFCRDAIFYWRVHQLQQGRKTVPRLVDRAGREFRAFVQKDRHLRSLILSHHPVQQKLVRRGIRQMVAESYLDWINFFDKPLELQTVRNLSVCCTDPTLLRLVLRFYIRMVRQKFFGKRMSPVKI